MLSFALEFLSHCLLTSSGLATNPFASPLVHWSIPMKSSRYFASVTAVGSSFGPALAPGKASNTFCKRLLLSLSTPP
ncbi:hypothetical protein DER45DRAFT_569656 [Fusarium avenaceum]|nr:hypothetical protein DER45DRAFT_569656 [Fusarium avenaceum]